jgi:hypothetical protein
MYQIPQLMSLTEIAEQAGLASTSIRVYRTRGKTPPPDAKIGSVPGWLPATIAAWVPTLTGKGHPCASARASHDISSEITDATSVARELISLVSQQSQVTDQDGRSPYQPGDHARQASWTAAGHLARTGIAYGAIPWVELAEALDLGAGSDEVTDAGQAAEVLRVVDEHLARARARLDARRPVPDWDDHVAVLAELEHVARRAADLRLVDMLEGLLTRASSASL